MNNYNLMKMKRYYKVIFFFIKNAFRISEMIKTIVLVAIWITINSQLSFAQSTGTIWLEDFLLPDGTTADNGTTSWSATDPHGIFSVNNNEFKVSDTGIHSEGVWTSDSINISGKTDVHISVDIRSKGALMNSSGILMDYLRVYYKLDGGTEVLISENLGSIDSPTTVSAGPLNGTNLQVIIRARATASNEFYYFDNVEITATTSLTAVATVNGVLSCTVLSVTLSGSSNTAGVTYNWTGPGGFSSNKQNPSVNTPGTYVLTVTNQMNGQTSTSSVEVTTAPPGPVTLWLEDFSLPDETTVDNGTTSWSATIPEDETCAVYNNEFRVFDTDINGECVWTSDSINISGKTDVRISVDVRSQGDLMNSSGILMDYLRVYYKFDGEPEVLISENLGSVDSATTVSAGPFYGTNLQVIIRARATASNEFYYFDNVKVIESNQLNVSASVSGLLTSTNTTVMLYGKSNVPGVIYSWSGPGDFASNEQNPLVNTLGTYTLTVINPMYGCTGTSSVDVTAMPTGLIILWLEDFSLPDGTTVDNGTTNWSATDPPGIFSVNNNEFEVSDTNILSEGVWTSGIINITGKTAVQISVDVRSKGDLMNSSGILMDYLRIYYKLDGGPEVLISENLGSINSAATVSAGPLNGTDLQVVIRARATASNEFYYFDNVKVKTTN